jgi:hypothetical protein
MPLCSKCQKRMAKRACPALGNGLCSLCCGILRNKEIHCPLSCVFLSRHKPYQEKRILERRLPGRTRDPFAEDDLVKDERLAWLAFQIESPVRIFAERAPGLTDKDILLAVEYARAKTEKGRSLIVLPGDNLKPKNELGEAVLQAVDSARWRAPVILSSGLENYKKEEKLRCLDRTIGTIRFLMQDDPGGQRYIRNLVERFARLRDAAQDNKLIRT